MDAVTVSIWQNIGILLLTSAVGVLTVGLLARLLDRMNRVSFRKDILPVMKKSAPALADYHGKRFIGLCLLIGLLVGMRMV